MQSRKREKHRPLRKLTMSYLSLLLVIVLLGGSTFLLTINVVAGQTARANALLLSQVCVRLESTLEEADFFAYTVNRLTTIRQLMQCGDTLTSEDVYRIRDTKNSLSALNDSGHLAAGYQIYLSGGDFILEPGNCCLNIDHLYGKSFYYGGMDVAQFRAQVLEAKNGVAFYPAAAAQVSGKSGRMLLYTRPLTNLYQQVGKILFYLDAAALETLFAPLAELSSGCVLLLSRDGALLFSSCPPPEGFSAAALAAASPPSGSYAEANRRTVFYQRLTASGCTLAVAMPDAVIIAQASAVLQPMLIGIATLVLAGIALTVGGLRANRRPLQKTLELLAAGGETGLAQRGFLHLDQAVHQLMSSRDLLSKRLEEQRTELRAAIVASLESGDTLDEGELDILLTHVGVQPEGDRFRGVYLVLREEGDIDTDELARGDMRRALVVELLAPFAPRISFLSLKDRASFILLYTQNEGEPEDLHGFFSALYNACQGVAGLEPSFFVGTECSRLCYLPHSLLAARQLMLAGEPSAFLSIAQSSATAAESYLYTEQHEKKLVALATMGKEEELFALLDGLYAENTRRGLSRFHRQLLFFRMVGTLSGVLSAASLPQELTFSLHRLSMDQFFALLRESYGFVCRRSREKSTARTEKLLSDVMDYIDRNCTQYSLSLASTALHFGITEKYLSAFIHEKAGITFSAYVEQLRIRKADELLAGTALTIDEIAQRVGYSSVKTFRRAYGRVAGIPPSEARKILLARRAPGNAGP